MIARPTYARIDLDALGSNLARIRTLTGARKICAVIKADAYGHGAVRVARRLADEKAEFLAVAFLEEALELRRAGIDLPILVLGSTDPRNAPIILEEGLSQTVSSADLAAALDAAARHIGAKAKIHLKIDTGMHRQGFPWNGLESIAEVLSASSNIAIEGAYSHFAESDSPDKTFSLLQMDRFVQALGFLEAAGLKPEIAHMANSAAILEIPGSAFDMVRPGIILYGLSPGGCAPLEGFSPVMSLRASITAIRDVEEGEGIGYGLIHRTRRPSRLGLLQVGYADGYPRLVSDRAQVLLRGKRVPVIGRICMDQTIIDLTDLPDARLGDEAILFGGLGLPASELAAMAGTIDYEITCGISPRVPRIYTE